MAEMFIPSRVRDRLIEAITELEEEIVAEIQVQVEADDPDAGPRTHAMKCSTTLSAGQN